MAGTGGDADNPQVYLSLAASTDGQSWEENRRFLGPFPFTGEEISFYSAVLSPDGGLNLAVSREDNRIHVYRSTDQGKSFTEISRTEPLPVRVMPRFFQTARGEYLLFATQTQTGAIANSLGIGYSHSSDGLNWSAFTPLSDEAGVRGTFLPRHISFGGREYVFYQAFNLGDISTFQIYMKVSSDGGRTWGLRSISPGLPILWTEWGTTLFSMTISVPILRWWTAVLPWHGNAAWRASRARSIMPK